MTSKKIKTALLPSIVKVSGYDVVVRSMTTSETAMSGAGGLYNWGEISLNLSSAPQQVAMCLMHELLHACFDHSALRCKYTDDGIEEEIVSALGFTLCQMIAQEDSFVEFIRNAFKGLPVEIPEDGMNIPITGGYGATQTCKRVKK